MSAGRGGRRRPRSEWAWLLDSDSDSDSDPELNANFHPPPRERIRTEWAWLFDSDSDSDSDPELGAVDFHPADRDLAREAIQQVGPLPPVLPPPPIVHPPGGEQMQQAVQESLAEERARIRNRIRNIISSVIRRRGSRTPSAYSSVKLAREAWMEVRKEFPDLQYSMKEGDPPSAIRFQPIYKDELEKFMRTQPVGVVDHHPEFVITFEYVGDPTILSKNMQMFRKAVSNIAHGYARIDDHPSAVPVNISDHGRYIELGRIPGGFINFYGSIARRFGYKINKYEERPIIRGMIYW